MTNVCDRFCTGCVFLGHANGKMNLCEYFLQTGVRRPCPAGTGCTVKDAGKKKIQWKHENDQTWKNREKREKQVLHKVCPRCGREFETDNSQRVYCSNQCKNKVAQKEFHQRHKAVLTITCAICGKKFTSTDGRRKCCSSECTAISRKLRYKRYDIKRGKRHEDLSVQGAAGAAQA